MLRATATHTNNLPDDDPEHGNLHPQLGRRKDYVEAMVEAMQVAGNIEMTPDEMVDSLQTELFTTAEYRSVSHGHHPIARECITASLLHHNDTDLWALTRTLRRIEWAGILRRHRIVFAEVDNIEKRWPVLMTDSPAIMYLIGRLRAQQGFVTDAAEWRCRAWEAFSGYGETFLQHSDESMVLRLLMRLVNLRGDERRTKPKAEFMRVLMDGYDCWIRGKPVEQIGYFHCELLRIYLEYRISGLDADAEERAVQNDNVRVMNIICHHLEAGHLFAAFNLFKFILKEASRRLSLQYMGLRLGRAVEDARDPDVLFDFFMSELHYACGVNTLEDVDEVGLISRCSVDLAWEQFKLATEHAKKVGNEVLEADIDLTRYIVATKLKVEEKRREHEAADDGRRFEYWDIKPIQKEFDSFLRRYGRREDADRIRETICRFRELLEMTGIEGAAGYLDAITAYHYKVTGSAHWKHSDFAIAAMRMAARRKSELIYALKACKSYEVKMRHLDFHDKHEMLRMKLHIQHGLDRLSEGIRTGKELVKACDKDKKLKEGSEARYEYLLLKTDLVGQVPAGRKRTDYINRLMAEFDRFIERDKKWMPTSTHIMQKSLLKSAFLSDMCGDPDQSAVGVEELWKSLRQYTDFKTNTIFRMNATLAEKDFIDFHRCLAQYKSGKRLPAIEYCRKMARESDAPSSVREACIGGTKERARRLRMGMHWKLLFIIMHVQEYEILMMEIEAREIEVEYIHTYDHAALWQAFESTYGYFLERGEFRLVGRVLCEIAKFCTARKRPVEAMNFYIMALDRLSDADKYGLTGTKVEEYMPQVFKNFGYEELFNLALSSQIEVEEGEEGSRHRRLDTFIWAQLKKGHEMRRVLGSKTIWEDSKTFIYELRTLIAFNVPQPDSIIIEWFERFKAVLGPDGCRPGWTTDREMISGAEQRKIEELKRAICKLEGHDAFRAPLAVLTGAPPQLNDLYELREHCHRGQNVVFIDYFEAFDNVYMLWDVKNMKRQKFSRDPESFVDCVRLDLTPGVIEKWMHDFLAAALNCDPITSLTELGTIFVRWVPRLSRIGDLIVIGNSWFSSRIPFHALHLARTEKGDSYTLSQRNTMVYTPSLLTLKQCMNRLARYQGRPKIPGGTVRISICAIPPHNASSLLKSQTKDALNKILGQFRRHRADEQAAFFDKLDVDKSTLKVQLMRTSDFVHFLCSALLQPTDGEPCNVAVSIGPKVQLTAREISREFRFAKGNAPLVMVLYVHPDLLKPKDAVVQNIPDGIVSAFLQAGAASVVSTLWPVPVGIAGRFSELFFSDFHEHKGKDPSRVWDVANAVRMAAWQIRQERGVSCPHWAAFILTGAWVRGFSVGGRIISDGEGTGMRTDWENIVQRDDEARAEQY
ncbi:hypothetical protein DRE_01483 [Drechslerella stenobrocha 248]|uniref:CHAT domain-containing protein n=1 Tax=Drechslerella stenobrocha 248 TaxID=1043628 RepID=W7HI99_9PEZI|nr:hypothetical protein DRE_01483 [Drechslerella stenobrocha 248]